jgi:hypothetical protein
MDVNQLTFGVERVPLTYRFFGTDLPPLQADLPLSKKT